MVVFHAIHCERIHQYLIFSSDLLPSRALYLGHRCCYRPPLVTQCRRARIFITKFHICVTGSPKAHAWLLVALGAGSALLSFFNFNLLPADEFLLALAAGIGSYYLLESPLRRIINLEWSTNPVYRNQRIDS